MELDLVMQAAAQQVVVVLVMVEQVEMDKVDLGMMDWEELNMIN
jgi:hypothetical protein